jgi:hypothetical protein
MYREALPAAVPSMSPPGNVRLYIKAGLILAALVAVMVVAAFAQPVGPMLTTTHLERLFLDVNGDGRPDLIVSAEVVLDGGPLSQAPEQ